jgi:hypothetical protein
MKDRLRLMVYHIFMAAVSLFVCQEVKKKLRLRQKPGGGYKSYR